MDWNYGMVAAYITGFIVLYVLMWVFIRPVRVALKIFINSLLGCLSMTVFNYIGAIYGITIGVNFWTAITCGLLGIPGFILILFTKWLYKI